MSYWGWPEFFRHLLMVFITLNWLSPGCRSICPTADWFECITPEEEVYCYYVTPGASTNAAQTAACADLHEDAVFAILNTKQTNEDCVIANVETLGVTTADSGTWIGLHKDTGSWKWLDGVEYPSSVYSYNFLNSAAGNCAALKQNPYTQIWLWYSKECSIDAQALCYVNMTSSVTTTEVPTTTLELTTTQEMTTTEPEITTTQEEVTSPYDATTPEIVVCNGEEVPSHTVLSGHSMLAGTFLTYTCQIGYSYVDLTNTRSRHCDENGLWTSDIPHCEAQVTCPADSDVIGLAQSPYSTEVTISCPEHHIFNTGEPLYDTVCSSSGIWSHTEQGIVCVSAQDSCGPIPYVENADVVSGDAHHIANLTINCHLGHRFPNGKVTAQLVCGSDKEWAWSEDLNSWECLVITCPEVQTVYKATADTTLAIFGTLVTIECNLGYQYPIRTTQKTTQCLESGNWSDVIPDCQQIYCLMPPVVEEGTTADSGNEALTILTYACKPGTRFWDGTEVKNVTCELTGNWSDAYLNCTGDRCVPLPEVLNANLSSRLASQGTVAEYTCHSGYYLPNGDSHITTKCTEELVWSTEVPDQCSAVDCGAPPDLERSDLTFFASTLLAATSNYSCVLGHVWTEPDGLVLSEDILASECSTDGNWTKFTASCLPIDCGEPEDVENATKSYTNTTYLSDVSYECVEAHWVRRDQSIQVVSCSSFGTWCCHEPCVEVTCPPIPIWDDTEFSTTVTSVGTRVNYTCKEGYYMEESHKTSKCLTTGYWQPDIPECHEEDTTPTEIEPTEAPKSASIGAISATCIGLVFGFIALLDFLSYGKRASVITHRFKGVTRKLRGEPKKPKKKHKNKEKKKKKKAVPMMTMQMSQEDTGKASPRDITPLLLTDYDGQVDWDLREMRDQLIKCDRLNIRKSSQTYEITNDDDDEQMASTTNGLPPAGYSGTTTKWSQKRKKLPNNNKRHKVRKQKDSCDFIDLEPLSSR